MKSLKSLILQSDKSQVLVGGQAVIEGVLMRIPESWAVAVRTPKNEIKFLAEKSPELGKGLFSRIPFVRGNIILFKSLALGIKALNYSAQVAMEEENKEKEQKKETPFYLLSQWQFPFLLVCYFSFIYPFLRHNWFLNHLSLEEIPSLSTLLMEFSESLVFLLLPLFILF